MDMTQWIAGYHVRVMDWYDGKHIYLNIAYYKPGSSLSRPPQAERSFLIPVEERQKVTDYLYSIVVNLADKYIWAMPDDTIREVRMAELGL